MEWAVHSITGFIEARREKAAQQQERQRESAMLRRDIHGPSHSGKQRRRDVSVLKKTKTPAMTDNQGNPMPPITADDIGDGFRAKQKKKALPKYNATR
jgi:hypothetical protein